MQFKMLMFGLMCNRCQLLFVPVVYRHVNTALLLRPSMLPWFGGAHVVFIECTAAITIITIIIHCISGLLRPSFLPWQFIELLKTVLSHPLGTCTTSYSSKYAPGNFSPRGARRLDCRIHTAVQCTPGVQLYHVLPNRTASMRLLT